MGTIAGYQVTDYLHQRALHSRRRDAFPDIDRACVLIRHYRPDDASTGAARSH
ncbi:hypothetical protein [Amycolatopsis sp. cmx-4-61]|uniref:hypothetical protein n=1 Tax=Amycolatopsis sp. cmx-4-61 TaxID=2790937 RepID=UPI0039787C5D